MTGVSQRLGAALLALLLATGCGDDDKDQGPQGGGGMGGDAGARGEGGQGAQGGGGAPSVLTITYQTPEGIGIEGGVVALDRVGGGAREEATTGADGSVVFEAEISDVAALIAYKEGHTFAGMSGERVVERGEVTIALTDYLAELPPGPPLATLSGTAANMMGATLHVSTSEQFAFHQATGPDWQVSVVEDQPFKLMASDFTVNPSGPRAVSQTLHAFYAAEPEGFSGSDTHDIDFMMSASTATLSGMVPFPSDAMLAGEGAMYFQVKTHADSTLSLGWPTDTAPSAGGNGFDFDATYVDMPSLSDAHPITTRFDVFAASGRQSWVTLEGAPVAGSNAVPFASPTTITDVAGDHDPVTFSWAQDSHTTGIFVAYADFGDNVIGVIEVTPANTSFALPMLPSNADEATVLAGLRVAVQTCPEVDGRQCRSGTLTRWVKMQ